MHQPVQWHEWGPEAFEKAKKELGWAPETSLKDGLAETLEYYKKRAEGVPVG